MVTSSPANETQETLGWDSVLESINLNKGRFWSMDVIQYHVNSSERF